MIVTPDALKTQQAQYLETAKKEPVHIENTDVLLVSEAEYQEKCDFYNIFYEFIKNGKITDPTLLNQFLPSEQTKTVEGKFKATAEELRAIAQQSEALLSKMSDDDLYDFVEG